MARIVIGHFGSALALRQAREVLETLTGEWPDLQLRPKSFPNDQGAQPLLDALAAGTVGLALLPAERLLAPLPEGVVLAAVPRRPDPRSALVTRGGADLGDLPEGARLGVFGERDAALLRVLHPGTSPTLLGTGLEEGLLQVKRGDLDGLVLPLSTLKGLGYQERAIPLEASVFTPAAGQGALAVLVREDDDLAAELAYSLQHRPSFDRVRAEWATAAALPGRTSGAMASVSYEGDLTLIACLVTDEGGLMQATVAGEASEAEELGRDLAQDMLDQLTQP